MMEVARSFRHFFFALALLGLLNAAYGQVPPTQEFRTWARGHVHPITSVTENAGAVDLKPIDNIIGGAHLVAFGEPIHGGHEPLAMRNRLIRYGVEHLGFSAVALETCLASSKQLYDYVLGRTAETDAALSEAFCYDFGDYPENLELIHWLRRYNFGKPPERQVRLYGIDLSGQYRPTAFHSVEAVLSYLDRANPQLAGEARSRYAGLISIFRADRYPKLSAAEKDACTGKIQDLIALIRRERTPLTAATSADDYDWALRQAISVGQDDAFLRSLPPNFDRSVPRWWEAYPPDKVWDYNAEMREVAMADNVLWVLQRECHRGKVFYFAHDEHVSADLGILGSPGKPLAGQYRQIRGAGSYLRSALGTDFFAIGTYFGHAEGFAAKDSPDPAAHSVEDMLASLSMPRFIMNLHELPASGPLHDWFQEAHATRASILRDATDTVSPSVAYDAIFYIDIITPTPPPPSR